MSSGVRTFLLVFLAVVAGLVAGAALWMWLMHESMMGMTARGGVGLAVMVVVVGAVVAACVWLSRSRPVA